MSSLDPANSTGNNNLFAQIQVFDQLVQELPGSGQPQPGLASSWKTSADLLTYTFTLRPAKFSDGTTITADDVAFDLNRAIDPKQDQGFSFLYTNVSGASAPNPTTVVIKMKRVDASLLAALTLPPSGIYSKAAFQRLGAAKFNLNPIGSGPFMVKTWTQGATLTLQKNPYYWRTGQPYVNTVEFRYAVDANARVLQIKSGETDVAQGIPFGQVASLKNQSAFRIQVAPYTVFWAVALSVRTPPFTDKLVRQALAYATPRDTINQVVLGGLGTPQNSMISGNTTYWDPTVPAYPFDLAKAKELLSKSSVPNGFTMPIMINSGEKDAQTAAEILQSEWAKIGVTVQIKIADNSVNDASYFKGDFSARLWGPSDISSDTPDDSEQASIMLDGTNKEWNSWWGFYNSPEASALVRQGVESVDPAKRRAAYVALQKLGMQDVPQIPILFAPTVTAVSSKVSQFQTLPSGWWRLEDVCMASS